MIKNIKKGLQTWAYIDPTTLKTKPIIEQPKTDRFVGSKYVLNLIILLLFRFLFYPNSSVSELEKLHIERLKEKERANAQQPKKVEPVVQQPVHKYVDNGYVFKRTIMNFLMIDN